MQRCWRRCANFSKELGGNLPSFAYRDIYAVVALIPRGKVATYGQVAQLAGLPGRARQVGYALSALNDKTIPWHRVVNARGEISHRPGDNAAAEMQRYRLETEGVVFDPHGRISLARNQWRPQSSTDGAGAMTTPVT
jgi:methylated-DNA-protein-cysteine methyltransferase-like protein